MCHSSASQVLERDLFTDEDASVTPRHRRGIELDDIIGTAAEHDLSFDKGHSTEFSNQPGAGTGRLVRTPLLRILNHCCNECVADPVHGPDKARLSSVVANRVADFRDKALEVGLGHERAWPEVSVNHFLGYCIRPTSQQKCEKIERLSGEMDLACPAANLPGAVVEAYVAESNMQISPSDVHLVSVTWQRRSPARDR